MGLNHAKEYSIAKAQRGPQKTKNPKKINKGNEAWHLTEKIQGDKKLSNWVIN